MTVHEAGLIAREEQHGLGLLDGLAEAAGREVDLAAGALGGVVAEPVLQERGVEGRGAQAVEAEALAGVDDGQLARQGQHGALGRRVGQLRRGGPDERHDRRRVDDAAARLLVPAQREHRVLAPVPHPLHVDVHRQVPDVVGRPHRVVVLPVHDPRVVERDVHPAPGVHGFDRRLYLAFLGDVADLEERRWGKGLRVSAFGFLAFWLAGKLAVRGADSGFSYLCLDPYGIRY